MHIAVFDPQVTLTDPAGSCTLRAVEAALGSHSVTVFSNRIDDRLAGRVTHVRVPAVGRPQVARFVTFFLCASLAYAVQRLRGAKYDLVQATETAVPFAGVSYVHFCHTAYLDGQRTAGTRWSLRRFVRQLDHRARSLLERRIYARTRVVAVSTGLAEEMATALDLDRETVLVVPNPVELDDLRRPGEVERTELRRRAGVSASSLVLVFVALGHFDRKGLPELLEALGDERLEKVELLVVGGTPDLVRATGVQVAKHGLSERVRLVGFQTDVRPWLWAADAFVLPSRYETFSLVAHQAAAASLPLVATRVHGLSDLFDVDEEIGVVIEMRNGSPDVLTALRRLVTLSPDALRAMASAAQRAVAPLGTDIFASRWQAVYADMEAGGASDRQPIVPWTSSP